MIMFKKNRNNGESDVESANLSEWEPRTSIGKDVKEGRITSIEQIFEKGKKISEIEIVNALLPNLKSRVISIDSVQRMTKNNRKQKFRVTVVVGDYNGHIGVGSAKDIEVKKAISNATKDAEYNIIPVMMGCGSWQCTCGLNHSMPFNVVGKCSSVEVTLIPAPRGLGIVASKPVKEMLELAGIKDAWSFSKGRTRAKYNTLIAVQNALLNTINMKNLSAKRVESVDYEKSN